MKKIYLLLVCLMALQVAVKAQDRIYYGVPSVAISSSKLDGSDIKQVVTISGQTYDMETDYYKGVLYWGEGSYVKKANIDGTNAQTLTTVSGQVGGLALDLTNNKLYFSRYSGSSNVLIMKCNLDGTNLDTIVTSPITNGNNYNLSISPTLQKLYWTEEATSGSSNSVLRCNLDGSNVETLMTISNFMPGLAIDEKNQKLYLAYWNDSQVMTTDMTCSTTPTLVFGSSNGTFQMAVDNINSKLYFAEMSSNKIRKCNLDGTSPADIVSSVFVMALSIPTVPAAPTIKENEIDTLKLNDFLFSGVDKDSLTKIQITSLVTKGTMFLDLNNDNIVDNGETIVLNQEIPVANIDSGLLKFKPLADDYGTPYTSFDFKWYNGTTYSPLTYTQYIYVTQVIPTGIEQPADASSITVYPTVTSDYINVKGNNNSDVVIYNTIGNVVLRTKAEKINIGSFGKGTYIVNIAGNTTKVIVK